MLSELIMEALEKEASERWICRSNYASRMGDKCVRKLCLYRTHWDVQQKMDVRGKARVELGRLLEQYSKDRINGVLRKYGIEIQGQEYPAKWDEFDISGKTDGLIYLSTQEIEAVKIMPEVSPSARNIRIVLEVKSVKDTIFGQIHTVDDLKNYWWMKKYLTQIQLYMVSAEIDYSILFLVSTDGRFKDFLVDQDLDQAEPCLKKAERIKKYMRDYEDAGRPHDDLEALNKILPDRITHDLETCKRCDLRMVCQPPMEFGDELQVIDHGELIQLLDARAKNKEARDIYDKAHKQVRSALGGRENVLAGNWHCKGKKDKRGTVKYEFTYLGTQEEREGVIEREPQLVEEK